jgi:hypothetical protein
MPAGKPSIKYRHEKRGSSESLEPLFSWRRGWDLNPRGRKPYPFSRRAHSTELCDLSTNWQMLQPAGEPSSPVQHPLKDSITGSFCTIFGRRGGEEARRRRGVDAWMRGCGYPPGLGARGQRCCVSSGLREATGRLQYSSHHRIIASSHHRIIASSHHRIIASSHHRIIASSHHRIIASSHSLENGESYGRHN